MITRGFQLNGDKQVGAENPKCISEICGILLYLGFNTGKEEKGKVLSEKVTVVHELPS